MKNRKLRLKDKELLNLLIGKTVEIAIEKGIIKSRTIIVDATHTGLRSTPKIKERFNMLKEVLADIEDYYVISKDENARIGHKSEKDAFFGYKIHIAMSDERIITAATVTLSEKGDGP